MSERLILFDRVRDGSRILVEMDAAGVPHENGEYRLSIYSEDAEAINQVRLSIESMYARRKPT